MPAGVEGAGPRPSLAEVGERALIERLSTLFAGALPPDPGPPPPNGLATRLGIGDDCAVLAPSAPGEELLLEVDEAVEGVHFRLDWMTAEDAGHRLATQGLSDLAAMGGEPRAALLALGAPGATPLERVLGIARGLAEQLARHGTAVVGGNVTACEGPLHLSLTVIGACPAGRAVRRAGARPGDALAVTGALGLARAGWRLCERGLAGAPSAAGALARYRRPEPRIAWGRALARDAHARAMIDLSDGLAGDLAQVARASGVGAVIDEDALPIPPALADAARLLGEDPRALALEGGDDFELLVAGAPRDLERAAADGVDLRIVGRVTAEPGRLLLRDRAGALRPLGGSYEHWRAAAPRLP